ncbi:MAG: nuclear transport factor 2 family protein [Solirubrobacteraceae bacterium]
MPSDNVQQIEAIYAAFARGDVAAVIDAVDADVEWVTPPTLPWSRGIYRGRAELGEYFHSFASALEDPEVHAHELHALPGGRVIALGVERGRARSTGTTFEARFVHLWNVHEGGVSAMQGLIDTAAIQSAFA